MPREANSLPDQRERAWRICDVCGCTSYCPVWLGVHCNGFIAQPDRMVRCHGHFVAVASDETQAERNPDA